MRDDRRVRRHLWWVLGLTLVLAGVILALVVHPGAPDDYGWFAYTPLETPIGQAPDWTMGWSDPSPSYVVSRWQVAGTVLAAAGLLLLAVRTGYLLGRRHARPSTDVG